MSCAKFLSSSLKRTSNCFIGFSSLSFVGRMKTMSDPISSTREAVGMCLWMNLVRGYTGNLNQCFKEVASMKSVSNTNFSFPVEGLMMVSWVDRSEMPSSTEAVVSTQLSTELAAEGASVLACTNTKVRINHKSKK